MKKHKRLQRKVNRRASWLTAALVFVVALTFVGALPPSSVLAGPCPANLQPQPKGVKVETNPPKALYCCGSGTKAVGMSIDIGCKGQSAGGNVNAMTDAVFAIIRFLSIGVGIVIVASLVWAGIQYSMARDDPSQVGAAKGRIMNTFAALLIYIFSYAILNYVIPAGFFK
jgi:hypothetical protein